MGGALAGIGNGCGQLFEIAALVEETGGAFAEVALAVGSCGVVAEDDEGDVGRCLAHGAQHLQAGLPLVPDDVLRPEGLSMMLVDQWMASDLPRRTWLLVNDVIQQHVVPVATASYRRLNQMLVTEGVLPQIDLSGRVRRSQGPVSRGGDPAAVPGAAGVSVAPVALPSGTPAAPAGSPAVWGVTAPASGASVPCHNPWPQAGLEGQNNSSPGRTPVP